MSLLPLTPRLKKAFALALRTAHEWGHNYIGTEHMLAGIARETDGPAAKMLAGLGVTPDAVREGTKPVPSPAVFIQRGGDACFIKSVPPADYLYLGMPPEWTMDAAAAKRFTPEEAEAVLKRLDTPFHAVPAPRA